jgi:hypothetical protein
VEELLAEFDVETERAEQARAPTRLESDEEECRPRRHGRVSSGQRKVHRKRE